MDWYLANSEETLLKYVVKSKTLVKERYENKKITRIDVKTFMGSLRGTQKALR